MLLNICPFLNKAFKGEIQIKYSKAFTHYLMLLCTPYCDHVPQSKVTKGMLSISIKKFFVSFQIKRK